MTSIREIAALHNLGLNCCSSSKRFLYFASQKPKNFAFQSNATISVTESPGLVITRKSEIRNFRFLKSVQLDMFVTSDDEEEMSDGFFEAIEELQRMVREPSDVLEEWNGKLSSRELQLVLVYFAQEGRDSWCALEVFEWLMKENRVDEEMQELMVLIMCTWVKKLIDGKRNAEDVVDLLVDMDCVGLKTGFSMVEKVISLYWDAGEKEGAVLFVREVLKRGISGMDIYKEGNKSGPAGYLGWRMMDEGSYMDAVKFVIQLKDSGLKPDVFSYLIAMTAVVKELNEFAKALRKLKVFARDGLIAELNMDNVRLIENYQENLLTDGLQLSNWVIEEGGPSYRGVVHERLLAMYICAGRGGEAEEQLWEMKLVGKEAGGDLCNIVLALCASRQEANSVKRLLTRMEVSSPLRRKKALSWLLRGYIKGGHFRNAAETVLRMLDLGLHPELLDRAAVLHGVSRRIQQPGNIDTYLTLCKRLSDADLIGPCLVYMHMRRHKLWVITML